MNLADLRAELLARSVPLGPDPARLVAVRHRIQVIRRRRTLTAVVLVCLAAYLVSPASWFSEPYHIAAGFPRHAVGAVLVGTDEDAIRQPVPLSVTVPLTEAGLVLSSYCEIPGQVGAYVTWIVSGQVIASTECGPAYGEYFQPETKAWTDAGLILDGDDITIYARVDVLGIIPPGARYGIAVLRPVSREE